MFGPCTRLRSGRKPAESTTTRSREVQRRAEAPALPPLRPGISSNEQPSYEKCVTAGDSVKYDGYLTIIGDDAATHDGVTAMYDNDQYASVSDYEHPREY